MVDVLVWTEMIVVRGVHGVVAVSDVINVDVRSNVGLAELIQDRSGSLGVDRRDLCHYLPVVVVRVVVVLAGRRLLLCWADLLCARSLGAVPVVPVLALVGLVW